MKFNHFVFSFFLLLSFNLPAQTIDVQHYKFSLGLTDKNDKIKGEAEITIQFLKPVKEFSLDLVQQKGNGKGMKVESVNSDNVAKFRQANDKIMVTLKKTTSVNQQQLFKIVYSGIPEDGLIISKNKFGDRTFFADNWPNRAHFWIPCNDVLSDKASVEFIIKAPAHYQTISNGIQTEVINSDSGYKQTRWQEDIVLPTKVMVIGVAKFSIARLDSNAAVPVTAYVYPQDQQKGFYDYAVANDILKFFSNYIAPFPFKKLANVESKTIFGGMENASAIFYAENSVTGNRAAEDLMVHEIAHQWFGDMATEKKFAHIWLSEGFASYMTDIYIENKYGKDSSAKRLQRERQQVIQFNHTNHKPVVDSVSELMDLLNVNSYQKGAWVLHMLRQQLGDTAFKQVISTYYNQFKGSNADTRDFEKVAEQISGKDLKPFFDQWLYQPGIPQVDVSWKYNENGTINFLVTQSGNTPFQFPLEIAVTLDTGTQVTKKYDIKDAITIIRLKLKGKPVKVTLDPNTNLLFKGKIAEEQ